MSGYLTRLSGDIRRDAPEPARGFARRAARPAPTIAVIAEIKRASPSRGRDRAGRRRRRDGPCATPTAAPLRCRCSCAERDFGGSLADLRPPAARSGCRRSRRTSPCFPSRSPPSGWPAPTRSSSSSRWSPTTRRRGSCRRRSCSAWTRSSRRTRPRRSSGRSALDAAIVGVNARDLETLEVDRDRQLELLATLPPSVVRVAESGIASRADVEAARDAGRRRRARRDVAHAPPGAARRAGGGAAVTLVKICGLMRPEDVDAAVAGRRRPGRLHPGRGHAALPRARPRPRPRGPRPRRRAHGGVSASGRPSQVRHPVERVRSGADL